MLQRLLNSTGKTEICSTTPTFYPAECVRGIFTIAWDSQTKGYLLRDLLCKPRSKSKPDSVLSLSREITLTSAHFMPLVFSVLGSVLDGTL